jgi:hypothetical protein
MNSAKTTDDNTTGEKTTGEKYSTVKIIIFVIIIVCIVVVIYYLYCYMTGDDDEGFFSGKSDVSVGWNIEEMVEKIHSRQRNNLSRLSKDSHYNI